MSLTKNKYDTPAPCPICTNCGLSIGQNHDQSIKPDGYYYHDNCCPKPPEVSVEGVFKIDKNIHDDRLICNKCKKPINHKGRKISSCGFHYHAICIDGDQSMDILTPEKAKEYIDKSQHSPGAKLDQGKNRLGLVLGGFSRALQQVGKVGTQGANKYSDNGWMEVDDGISRYTDAMLRHYMKEAEGEKFDPELSDMAGEDIYHAACVAWNALARLDLMLCEDD